MPRLAKPLTELQISRARVTGKAYTLPDGNGLHLAVSAAGLKTWVVRYRLPGSSTATPATIGRYPTMTLAEARVCAVEAKRDAAQGKVTAGLRKVQQASMAEQEVQARERVEQERATFRAVSGRWLAEKRPTWAPETHRKARLVVDSYLVPKLGDADMRTLETKDVRPVLLEMAASTPQLARKARQYVGNIVDRAINEGLRPDESSLRLARSLPSFRGGHMPAVTDDDGRLGEVMRAIDTHGNRVVRAALMLAALTVMRSGVVASARWAEIDLEAAEWRIPGLEAGGWNIPGQEAGSKERRRMKTGQDFTTSLPTQAVEALREMHARSAGEEYVFPPQARQKTPHLSRDALSKALRDMGFRGKHTPHGNRASLRTLGRERLGIDVDVLEAQLAHAPKDEVEAAYARVKFKEQRREVMQAWADYLDRLRAGNVVEFKRKA